MRPLLLIVGESASKKDPGGVLTLKSQSGRRLVEWMGKIDPYGEWDVMRCNMSDIDEMNILEFLKIDAVITLGVKASSYMKNLNKQHFVLPHPSGRNRKLNDKEYVRQALLNASCYLAVLSYNRSRA